MGKDLISVIMPAYNAEAFIRQAIESVIKQTYLNWELIVVDDGSTDSTAEIVKGFARNNKKVKYLYQPNGGQGKARNLAISNSKGGYIAFLDADDMWTKDKLAIQSHILSKEKDVDLVFSQGYNVIDGAISEFDVQIKTVWDIASLPEFLKQNQIPILSVLAKRSALLKARNFTEDAGIQNAEDYHLWLKMLLTGSKFKSIQNRLFYYRVHPAQATYQENNISSPVFNAYLDIYKYANTADQKKAFIEVLKWYVFQPDFHADCIDLFAFHLRQKGMKVISLVVKNVFTHRSALSGRTAFKLISLFG